MTYRLLTSRSAAEAHVVVGALRAEGLDVKLERNGFGAVYGLTSGPFATRVVVAEEDYVAAKQFLDGVENSQA